LSWNIIFSGGFWVGGMAISSRSGISLARLGRTG
jgi:hypothetical protein